MLTKQMLPPRRESAFFSNSSVESRDTHALEFRQVPRRLVERRDDDAVDVSRGQLGDGPHRQAQEMAAAVALEDVDGLEAELLEREIGQLGGLARAPQRDALHAVLGQLGHGLAQVAPGTPKEVQRVPHVLVGEAGLLGHALGGQHVAQALARVGLGRKLPDLDEALAGEPLDVEIGQAERDTETRCQRALGQRGAFFNGGEDLQLPLDLPLDGHGVQYMNTGPRPSQTTRNPP